jgi:NAD(P)-dependent dehydrogenase (short-subunit alcohol dehydrogenase family)
MKIIVITGSTRGIGYGLADAFLDLGQAVVISGRHQATVDKAVGALSQAHEGAAILGQPCDVTQAKQVQALWDLTKAHFGRVDIWINNAGVSQSLADVRELPPQDMAAMVETNILGTLYGSQVALNGMMEQGFGALYNMEGLGSNGRKQPGVTVYGATKRAIRYLDEVLEMEMRDTSVLVGALLPGMVVTDILTAPYADRPEQWEEDKRIFNILADRVETVTPWMAREILANKKHGARINWNRRGRLTVRFLTAPFRRRQVVD